MMADRESVGPAMDKTAQPSHDVDYYYLEAMRYLTCKAVQHSDDESGDEGEVGEHDCKCSRCRAEQHTSSTESGLGADHSEADDHTDAGEPGRERSWSHSMAKDRESGTLPELPVIDGKYVGGRLKNRRYSTGMILKKNMKTTVQRTQLPDGHVHWADECKKELTRFRPRKKYSRSPAIANAPVRSILKNCSEESLVVRDSLNSSELSDTDTDD